MRTRVRVNVANCKRTRASETERKTRYNGEGGEEGTDETETERVTHTHKVGRWEGGGIAVVGRTDSCVCGRWDGRGRRRAGQCIGLLWERIPL